MYIYINIHIHLFFIHTSVDGHLDCFCILVTVNMMLYEHWSACIFELVFSSFLDIYPGVESLSHMVACTHTW